MHNCYIQMVSLYRDPTGEKIFDSKNPASTISARSGMITQQMMDPESQQVTKLQNRIKELERKLANSERKVRT